jgi:acetyl esterase/lipase
VLRPLVALAVAIGCGSSPAPSPPTPAPPRNDPPWVAEVARARIVYAVPGMAQQTARQDLVYKRAGSDVLQLDLWAPKQAGVHPAIVFIHGGPVPGDLRTQPKDWGVYVSYGQLAAASGFVGVTFNHRLYGPDRIADAHSDVRDLVGHLRANAARYRIDPDRICLWAFSGGGSLVSAAFGDQLPGVRCLVSFYGVLDREPPELSPVKLVAAGKRVPPMLIARAGKDDPAINETVDAFLREAKAHDAPVQMIEHPTGQHAFDLRDDDDRSREIIAAAVRFVGSHTRP